MLPEYTIIHFFYTFSKVHWTFFSFCFFTVICIFSLFPSRTKELSLFSLSTFCYKCHNRFCFFLISRLFFVFTVSFENLQTCFAMRLNSRLEWSLLIRTDFVLSSPRGTRRKKIYIKKATKKRKKRLENCHMMCHVVYSYLSGFKYTNDLRKD